MGEFVETMKRAPASVLLFVIGFVGFAWKVLEDGRVIDDGPWTVIFFAVLFVGAMGMCRVSYDSKKAARANAMKRRSSQYGERHV